MLIFSTNNKDIKVDLMEEINIVITKLLIYAIKASIFLFNTVLANLFLLISLTWQIIKRTFSLI